MIVPTRTRYEHHLSDVLSRVYKLLHKKPDGMTCFELSEQLKWGIEQVANALQYGVSKGWLLSVPYVNKFRLTYEKWIEMEAAA